MELQKAFEELELTQIVKAVLTIPVMVAVIIWIFSELLRWEKLFNAVSKHIIKI